MSHKRNNKPQMPNHTDIWDDTLLIQKYDESIMLAKEVVAKRIAQSTNTTAAIDPAVAVVEPTSSTSASDQIPTVDSGVQLEPFKAGDWVRSTFTEDGLDYEAQILSIDANEMCHIRYIGYDNEEYVDVSTLIDSWGEAARLEQQQLAAGGSATSTHVESAQQMHIDEGAMSAAEQSCSSNANKKPASKSTSKKNKSKTFERYRASMMIPPPPPLPPMLGAAGGDNDDPESEYLSSMLMAWYMSGYYTGLYQGQKLATAKRTQMTGGENADDENDVDE